MGHPLGAHHGGPMGPPPSTAGGFKVFPPRPNTMWTTKVVHDGDATSNGMDLGPLEFTASLVWRAGCELEWPFGDMTDHAVSRSDSKPLSPIKCSWKKEFKEVEKYMNEIRPGGKKQHLNHHWMLCEIHPYSTADVGHYGDFCNFFKDLGRVSAAMSKSEKHQHLLFYLCPPDEHVLPEQYLDDIFECQMPKGLLWCLIFIKNLDDKAKSNSVSVGAAGGNKKSVTPSATKDPRHHRDPR